MYSQPFPGNPKQSEFVLMGIIKYSNYRIEHALGILIKQLCRKFCEFRDELLLIRCVVFAQANFINATIQY